MQIAPPLSKEFEQPVSAGIPSSSLRRPRLAYLDGIRGLAALYVVLHHIYLDVVYSGEKLSPLVAVLSKWLSYGYASVSVFIVLSGYCLMLPVVLSPEQELPGGFVEYLRRRARRILPAYYAALVMAYVLVKSIPDLRIPRGIWAAALPVFSKGVLFSHLFMVHNLCEDWSRKVDYPMWSVATEWQIYFIFPLLLLPLARRFGVLSSVGIAFVLGYAPHVLGKGWLDCASPWYLLLFAFGMWSAQQCFGSGANRKLMKWSCSRWFLLAAAPLLPAVALLAMPRFVPAVHRAPAFDLLIGLSMSCTLVFLYESGLSSGLYSAFGGLIKQAFESRVMKFFGSVSYSLYLFHAVVLVLIQSLLRQLMPVDKCTGDVHFCLLLLCAVPASIAVAYFASLLFERPFLKSGAGAVGRIGALQRGEA